MNIVTFGGSAFDVGRRLGEFGREAWQQKIRATALWQTVSAMQASAPCLAMQALVEQCFPLIWQELQGLAAGLDAPLAEVFAWNCRGDLVRSTSDGCTTVAAATADGAIIAHNEDGFPQLRDDCALVHIRPDDGAAFTSFAYPGSLCGHTFAVNEYGIVNTVNNIRAVDRPQGLPRQVLARAALNAASLDEAVAILTTLPRAGAFHHTLGQAGDARIFSVEATAGASSVQPLSRAFGHANHLIHTRMAAQEQVITASSAARQQRLGQLLDDGRWDAGRALAILSDAHNPDLPIYRLAADDPDDENTLATACFTLSAQGVSWQVFRTNRQTAENHGFVAK